MFTFKFVSSFKWRGLFSNAALGRTNWKKINEGPLKKVGLLTRRVMINKIRKDRSKSQSPSRPGHPPKSRAPGHPFRQVFSIPDRTAQRWVVIGHRTFGAPQTAMEIHEFGQMIPVRIPIRQRKKALTRRQALAARQLYLQGKLKHKPQQYVTKLIRMPKREFAKPTLRVVLPKIPAMWRGAVRN